MSEQPATTAVAQPAQPSSLAPLRLEGERRVATVILADVRGSTDLLERVGTETWVALMNEMFQVLETEIYRFGGQVNQFRGDGLVAFFGAATAHEDDPERAVLAGLAMQTALQRYARTPGRRGGGDLQLRVGINTGEVIVTSVGDRQHYSEDTAMGEAITVAARMESAAEPGTVLVSAATYALTKADFEWQALGEMMVKGLSAPIAVYRPLRPRPEASEVHSRLGMCDLAVPLIGRDAEFQTLNECVAAVRNERGGVVLLMGERGMGKSFLMSRVRQNVTRQDALLAEAQGADAPLQRPVTWLRGHGRSYDSERPYSLWADYLYRWLEMRADEAPEVAGARLYHRLEELLAEQAREAYLYLATLLDLPVEPSAAERLRQMDAVRLQQEIFRIVYLCIEALAQRGPVVFVFNDLHWADASSLALLKHCLPLCDSAAILWILMFRPDRASPMWAFRHFVETEFPHRLTSMLLGPLTRRQSAEFIERLIGAEVLPEATRELLLDRAEGNPYYIEELIRALIDRGVLNRDADGVWCAARDVDSLDLPDSLQSLLRSRIDGLPPATRRVLQMAAAIGRVFWSELLQGLVNVAWGSDRPPGSVQEHLTALQRAQLIYEQGRVPDLGIAYVFRSTLLYEVVYDGLLTSQRSLYHLRVAEYFENNLSAESRSQYYGLLVYHYSRAGRPDREIEYVLLAARQARQIYANAEALNHYVHALELLDALEAAAQTETELEGLLVRRFEVHASRAEIFRLLGNEARFREEAGVMLTLAQRLPQHPAILIDALLVQPGVSGWQSVEELHAGGPLVAQALQLARELGDRKREMRALAAHAGHYYNLGNPAWLELGENAVQLARELGDRRFEVSLLTAVGEIFAISDPQRSMEYLELALPICQELGDKMAQIELLQLLGTLMENGGDYYRRLKECHEPQLQLCREIGFRNGESYALMFIGQIRGVYLGDFEAALTALELSLELSADAPEAAIFRILRMVQIYIERGQLAEARALLEPECPLEAALQAPQRPGISYEANRDLLTFGQLGVNLVWMMLCNAIGDLHHLRMMLELAQRVQGNFGEDSHFSQQYLMVVGVKVAQAQLKLAALEVDPLRRQQHVDAALAASHAALETYQIYGYVRPVEATEEELLYTHHLALKASGAHAPAIEYLKRAYETMMRKHALIPEGTPYRRTYLENLTLHRELRAAYAMSVAQIQWDGSRVRVQLEG